MTGGGGLILALRKSACGTAVIDLENYFGRLLGTVFPDLRGRMAVLRAEMYKQTTFPGMYSNLKIFILPVFPAFFQSQSRTPPTLA